MGAEGSFVGSFFISGGAAVVSKTAAAPVERIKLMLQSQGEMMKQGRITREYRGIVDCFIQIFKHEGVAAFWRGNAANCLRYFPTQALNFAFKDKIKSFFPSPPKQTRLHKLRNNTLAGGIGGTLALTIVYSLDFSRTMLANDTKNTSGNRKYKNLRDVYRVTIHEEGYRGLYRGFATAAVSIFIYRALYFGLYDTLTPIWVGDRSKFFTNFAFGFVCTAIASSIPYPTDTVRRRMIMTSGTGVHYSGFWDAWCQIYRNEGLGSLYKGLGANILRSIAGGGVLAGTDFVKNIYYS